MKRDERRKTKDEILAVVMARGGSVGLPGKSLRPLLGRPVLSYSLDHVRESRLITRTVVSSDDKAILALAEAEGFETVLRPAELATATSATDPVLRHAVRKLFGAESIPDAVVMLYGNIPIRRGGMIDQCVEMLLNTGADSVQTIAPVGKMHPYWMFDLDSANRIQKHVPNHVFRRQDLPPLFSPTGAVYAMRTEVLMAAEGSPDPHAFLGMDRRGLITTAEDSVDIDTEKDLFMAEAILRWLVQCWSGLGQGKGKALPACVREVLSLPAERGLSRLGVHLRATRFDASYLEFLDAQIKLEPRGPEWTAVLRRRRAELAPYVSQELLNLSIETAKGGCILYAKPDSYAIVYVEAP